MKRRLSIMLTPFGRFFAAALIANLLILFSSVVSGNARRAAHGSLLPQEKTEWNRYFDSGEEFSVLLPETPAFEFKSRPDKEISARYQGRIYGAYGDGVVYVIISENNPRHAEKLDTFIKEFMRTLPRHVKLGSGAAKFDQEIQLDNFPGKRYRLEFYEGTKGIVDFYLTNKHVYIVEAAGGDESNPSVQRFLSSFSLDEKLLEKAKTSGGMQPEPQASPEPTTNDGQTSEKIFTGKEVDRHPLIILRPEPFYTDDARGKNITGTVILKGVLSASGHVTDIKVVKSLGYGLTAKAAIVAGKIKFIPAMKDGKYVSQYIQFEYGFHLN